MICENYLTSLMKAQMNGRFEAIRKQAELNMLEDDIKNATNFRNSIADGLQKLSVITESGGFHGESFGHANRGRSEVVNCVLRSLFLSPRWWPPARFRAGLPLRFPMDRSRLSRTR